MSTACPKCGGAMDAGIATSDWEQTHQHRMVFLIGMPTSRNPVKAFIQGLRHSEQPSDNYFIKGLRCRDCGFLELYATESRELANGKCPKCGYDLRATPDRCPECGARGEKI